MSLQSLLRKFHDSIKLRRLVENGELIEKRDRVLTRLRENLKKKYSVTFTDFPQGSYAMDTGIKPPVDGDYDIDIGVVLNDIYQDKDAVAAKEMVFRSVEGHTSRPPAFRRSCITVYYQLAGEVIYHVDLAVMTRDRYNANSLYLAIGKQNSELNKRQWQPDDRKGFMAAVESKFAGEDAVQFKRIVRLLKRWKNNHFSLEGHAAPTGLGLTVAAYQSFSPIKARASYYESETYDDLSALLNVARWLKSQFSQSWDNASSRYFHTLSLFFPTVPRDNVFGKMTAQQQEEFYQRVDKLNSNLEQAKMTDNALYLQKIFGSDFPLS